MIKVAITGNIASGKTEAEKILKEFGYKVFDTDKIAHEILNNSMEIKKAFNNYDIMNEDNTISRKKLGNLVFCDNELKQKLENIIHPIIKIKIQNIFNEYKNEKFIFIGIPLLFEANMQDLFDKIILIYCDNNIRLERLIKRNNITKESAIQRMNSQLSQDDKINLSDFIIKNETNLSNLKSELKRIF